MDAEFWHQCWQNNQIRFHEGEANKLLVKHFDGAFGKPGSRIFLPLCGKTRDIAWFLAKGHCVAGAELSPVAIRQLFAELAVEPKITDLGNLTRYEAENIDIFVGDIFDLTSSMLGPVDMIYDRAALVALPETMRADYAAHMVEITKTAPQFLVTFEYDQSARDGPPFSVDENEIRKLYDEHYDLSEIERTEIEGGLKGRWPASESVWLLRVKNGT